MIYKEGEVYLPKLDPQRAFSTGVISDSNHPEIVCLYTYQILNHWLLNRDSLPQTPRRYLTVNTRGLVNSAIKGFYILYKKDKFPAQEQLRFFLQDSADRIGQFSDSDKQAFNHAAVVFSFLPYSYNELESIPEEFKFKHIFTPPETTMDFYQRLSELKTEVLKIATGRNFNNRTQNNRSEVLRTVAFFELGKNIPIRV